MAGKDLKKLYDFLQDAKTYYLATTEGDQPHVRPFGTALLYEDKIYILTSASKDVAKQLEKNPKFELSTMDSSSRWLRASGSVKADKRIEVHNAMLEAYPHLKATYTAGDKNTLTLALENIKASIYSFAAAPEVLDV